MERREAARVAVRRRPRGRRGEQVRRRAGAERPVVQEGPVVGRHAVVAAREARLVRGGGRGRVPAEQVDRRVAGDIFREAVPGRRREDLRRYFRVRAGVVQREAPLVVGVGPAGRVAGDG